MTPTATKPGPAAKDAAMYERMKTHLAARITETEVALDAARTRAAELTVDAEAGDEAALKGLSAAERTVDKLTAEIARLTDALAHTERALADAEQKAQVEERRRLASEYVGHRDACHAASEKLFAELEALSGVATQIREHDRDALRLANALELPDNGTGRHGVRGQAYAAVIVKGILSGERLPGRAYEAARDVLVGDWRTGALDEALKRLGA